MQGKVSPPTDYQSKYLPPLITDSWPPLIHEEKKERISLESHLPPLLRDYIPPTLYDEPHSNAHAPFGKGNDLNEFYNPLPIMNSSSTSDSNSDYINNSVFLSQREISPNAELHSEPEILMKGTKEIMHVEKEQINTPVYTYSNRFYQPIFTHEGIQLYRKPMSEPDSPISRMENTQLNIYPKRSDIHIIMKDKPQSDNSQVKESESTVQPTAQDTSLEEGLEDYGWYDVDEETVSKSSLLLDKEEIPTFVPLVGSKEGRVNASKSSMFPQINYKSMADRNQYLVLSVDTQYSEEELERGIYSTGKE